MALSLDSHLRPHDAVVVTEVDGEDGPEGVLLHLESKQYFSLNTTGIRIWQLLGRHRSLAQVCDCLAEEFDADASTLEAAVVQLSNELLAQQLVHQDVPA